MRGCDVCIVGISAYVKAGGGLPCAEQLRWTSLPRSTDIVVSGRGVNLGGILPVASGNIFFLYHSYKRRRDYNIPVTVNVAGGLLFRSCVNECRVRQEYLAKPSSGRAARMCKSPLPEVTT